MQAEKHADVQVLCQQHAKVDSLPDAAVQNHQEAHVLISL